MRKYGILVSAFLLVMVQGNVSAQPVLFATTGSGQGFPIKTMRLVTNEAGAGSDVATRLIAQGLAASLGQAAIVENRGGSSLIPTQIVMNAPPDGHTLYSATTNLWILPLLQTVPYDTLRDFSPITLAVSSPNVIAVHPSVSVHSVKDQPAPPLSLRRSCSSTWPASTYCTFPTAVPHLHSMPWLRGRCS
jgi:tripartite-type tricarboxylate transporter receptor subunit TctC